MRKIKLRFEDLEYNVSNICGRLIDNYSSGSPILVELEYDYQDPINAQIYKMPFKDVDGDIIGSKIIFSATKEYKVEYALRLRTKSVDGSTYVSLVNDDEFIKELKYEKGSI